MENFIHAMENNSDMTLLLTRLFSKCRHFGTTAMTKLARHGNVPEMCAKSSIKRNMCLKLFFVLSEKQSANMPHLFLRVSTDCRCVTHSKRVVKIAVCQ